MRDISSPAGAVLFSSANPASLNIMRHLESDWKWKKRTDLLYSFSSCAKDDCCMGMQAFGSPKSIIEIEPPQECGADYFLYASTHKSETGQPALTAHVPGNWSHADFGGHPRTLNTAYAGKLKQILQFLAEGSRRHELGWPVNMEVDHHGPTPNGGARALIFVEIGSGPEQWENELAGKVVAEAMMKALFRPAPPAPAFFGIGGTHYAPKFTSIMLTGGEAVGHVLPKYHAASFDENMLKQALEKNVEPLEGALIDWKGLGKEERERIIALLEKEGVKYRRA